MRPKFPTRWFNRFLCYAGLFGLLFQGMAALHAWFHGIELQSFWFLLVAPLLCLASGLIPALQLQKEPHQ